MNRLPRPYAGDIWDAELEPVVGHEQGGRRPVLIVSSDMMNQSPAQLVIVAPLTRTDRGIPGHVRIAAPEGGLTDQSIVLCDQVRTISTLRLRRYRGTVRAMTLRDVRRSLMVFLDLPGG